MALPTGGQKAREEAAKKPFGNFQKTNYFSLKNGESIIIRMIDDSQAWPYVQQHSFVPTKGAPPDWKSEAKDGLPAKKWPEQMNAVCRKQKDEGELIFPEYNGECFICDEMTNPKNKRGKYYPGIKLWARAIVREAIIGTDQMVADGKIRENQVGRMVGFRDKMIDHQETNAEGEAVGPVKKIPEIVVINQGMKNFFGAFQAVWDTYGTVLDRDFKITRVGEGLETNYDIVPMDPIEKDGKRWTLEDPEIKAEYDKFVDLSPIIEEQASDRHFDTFFDTRPGHEHPSSKKDEKKGSAKDSAAKDDEAGVGQSPLSGTEQPEDVPEEQMEGFRERLLAKAGLANNSEPEQG